MSTLPVVEEILRETREPMSVRQIVEYAKGRLPTKSKTPDTVVARDLSMDIKRKGEESLFARVAPGRYTMRAFVGSMSSTEASPNGEPTGILASAMKHDRAGTLPAPTPASMAAPESAGSSPSS
jgi:hypothetical protein